jgi:DNA-binding CsgD family transcriptional regulator
VRALLAADPGGEVESATADRLWQATHGNPLFLRELCRDALEAGTLARQHGVWAWTAEPFSGPRLHDLVTGRLGRLAGDERRLAGLLALGGPLPLAQVDALAAPEALAALRARGLVDVEDGDRRLVRLAHPLAADGLRGQLGPLEASDLYAALARSHGAGRGGDRPGAVDADDRLRLAVWSISGNVPAEPALLAAAAADARHRDDPALAERLARAALGQPPSTGVAVEPPTVPPPCAVGFAAALTLGEALGDLRRPDEAEAVLAPLAAIARDDHQRARVALARLAALRLRPDRLDHARALAAATGIRDPIAGDVVRAGLAATLSHAGAIEEGGRLAGDLVGGTEDAVRLRALAPAATWLVHAGRAEESVRIAEAALPRALAHRDEALRARGWTALATVIGLVTAGHVDDADAAVTAAFADPISRRHLDHGMLALLRGRVALSQGRPATARTAFGEAALGLRRSDPVGREAWALSLLAESQALLGDGPGARATLDERPTWGQSRRYEADIARAELWVVAAEGEVAKAAGRAVELADEAEASGYQGFALLFLDAAVRLGATGLADRVVAVAGRVEGPFAEVLAALVPALAAGDGAALDAAAERLAGLGIHLHAAEAATHAARAHRRAGAARHARASADRAARLSARCEGAWTPALAGGSALDALTPREREVVLLAGRGLSSRAIAEHLTVSVRTIDNQLGRAYRKLGITSRADLATLLRNAPGAAPTP